MRKKLLLALLFAVGTTGAFAQTTHEISCSTSENFTIENGDTVDFNVNGAVAASYELECTSAPEGVSLAAFSASGSGLLSLGGRLLRVVPEVDGTYVFSYEKSDIVGVTNNFTMTVQTTLGNNNLEKLPEFSASYYAGTLTITNASEVTNISILSISGATVYSSNKAEGSIDVSFLVNGIYVLAVEQGGSRMTKKFVKN